MDTQSTKDVSKERYVQHKLQRLPYNYIFLFAIFIIIILSFISVYQFYNLLKSNRWVTHTYQVITTTQNSLYNLTYLEMRQRGYLLFNDGNYLPSYNDNLNKIKSSLEQLNILTKDNPAQHAKMIHLSDLLYKRIDLLNKTIQIKNKYGLSSTETIDSFQSGQISSDELRDIANEIMHEEYTLLKERNNIAIENAKNANLVFITGQIISVIFLLTAFILFNQELNKRKQTEEKTYHIESQLRSIIEGANDMIAALDLDYRFIIFNQKYEDEFKRLFEKQILVGMSLDEALSHVPEVLNKLKILWTQSLQGKEYVKNVELHIHDQRIIYEVTSSLIKDSQNKIFGAVHIKRNITERINREDRLNLGFHELKDKNEKITLLLEMSDVMLACKSISELSEITAKYCGKVLSFSKGIFYIMHPSKDFLEANSTWGKPISTTNHFTDDQCWSLRLGHIHHAGFTDTDLTCDHVAGHIHNDLCYLCVPLRAQNDIYGLLYVEVLKKDGKYNLSSNEKLLINAFAELAALALANVRLRENLSYQSIRDPLTSLYNRRYLQEFLLKQIYQSERSERSLSVLMLDLDHFKRINDVNGHDAGDLILKQFSQLLTKEIRPGDLVARYGGEEFIIVFYDTDAKTALKRANNIRESVSLLHVKFGAQDTGKITVSIGIAEYPQDGKNSGELIERADKALYVAKNTGRNKVVLFADTHKNLQTIKEHIKSE